MAILKEFKEFAVRGNAFEIAVGFILGAAFTSIVKSLVDDIISPLVGIFTGGTDFSNLFINLSGESYDSLTTAQEAGAAVISYGVFINALISFVIVAWCLFLIVQTLNRFKKEEVIVKNTEKTCPHCKSSVHKEASRCPQCTSELKITNR